MPSKKPGKGRFGDLNPPHADQLTDQQFSELNERRLAATDALVRCLKGNNPADMGAQMPKLTEPVAPPAPEASGEILFSGNIPLQITPEGIVKLIKPVCHFTGHRLSDGGVLVELALKNTPFAVGDDGLIIPVIVTSDLLKRGSAALDTIGDAIRNAAQNGISAASPGYSLDLSGRNPFLSIARSVVDHAL